jgi:uncharacterized protein YbjT (DUF2867 family)
VQECIEMNLVVLGATGHTVTALVRTPEKLTTGHSNLRVVTGEATEAKAVSGALEGADAVISALGGKGSVIADSTRAIVAGARKAGVSRVIVLSTFAAERDRLDAVTRLLTGIGMGAMLKDKGAGEEMLRRSDLEWTIVYASLLSDGPASGSVVVLPQGAKRGLSQKISRATWRRGWSTPPPVFNTAAAASGSQAELGSQKTSHWRTQGGAPGPQDPRLGATTYEDGSRAKRRQPIPAASCAALR